MDQFRHVGEVLGSLRALMVLKDDITINQRQCCLLLDMFNLAFETIGEEIKRNMRLDEKNTKWKALEHPMKDLHRIFKEGEIYIRNCLDIKDWWAKAISLHQNKDCVEFHIHNLLCCFPMVIEALETAGQVSGLDPEDMQKRRVMLMKKYDGECIDSKLFQWKYGKQYLVPREICNRLDSAWREDRWILLETIRDKKSLSKHEERLVEFLLKMLNGLNPFSEKLLPSWVLIGAKDYQVKRRLGSVSHFKEIQWLGENFALRNFFGEIGSLNDEISFVMSLSHPNIMQYICAFYDEERKEGYIVMELMSKNLCNYIKENCSQKKKIPFSQTVSVDVMLQIARGMEYLHSKKIYHGGLNSSNILLKPTMNSPTDGYFYAKITGFGLTSIKIYTSRSSSNQVGTNPVIWYAPEVLAEQEQPGNKCSSKYTEKADVYSFGMICFHILTGKIPFEDSHLQEDKMGRNIRAGERPLFPFSTPKYFASFTKKCWQADPTHRPSFSTLCRMLRYIKKCLVINPDQGQQQPESPPLQVDFLDVEADFSKKFLAANGSPDLAPVSLVPFQMFGYKLIEKEKTYGSFKDRDWNLTSEGAFNGPNSNFGDEIGVGNEDPFLAAIDRRSVYSEVQDRKTSSRMGLDQRSVCSEAPQRRIFAKPVNLEIPFRKNDRDSIRSLTPERSLPPRPEAAEKRTPPSVAADEKSISSEIVERKNLIAAIDQKLEILDKTSLSMKAANDQKSVFPEISEKRVLRRTSSDQMSISSSQILEKKVLSPIATDQSSIASDITEKTFVPTRASERKSVHSKIPERKISSAKKPTDAKTIKSPGKGPSPRLSQTRKPKVPSTRTSPTSSPPQHLCTRCSKVDGEIHSSKFTSPCRNRKEPSDSDMTRCNLATPTIEQRNL